VGRLICTGITSLDGYIADERGDFSWAAPDVAVHAFVNDLERSIGTYLYGRRMFEVMRYWETADGLPDRPEVEILYALDTPYWGRGVATEAAAAALRHGFEATRLDRIVAVAMPAHHRSHRVMEKLGMIYEGMIEVYGGFRAVLYGISREAFLSRVTSASSAGGKA